MAWLTLSSRQSYEGHTIPFTYKEENQGTKGLSNLPQQINVLKKKSYVALESRCLNTKLYSLS